MRPLAPLRSPPLPFARPVRPSGLIEGVERLHVTAGELEVKDPRVLLDPLPMSRLRNHDRPARYAPADQDLRRGPPEVLRDLGDRRMREVSSGAERAVRLQPDAPLLTRLKQ